MLATCQDRPGWSDAESRFKSGLQYRHQRCIKGDEVQMQNYLPHFPGLSTCLRTEMSCMVLWQFSPAKPSYKWITTQFCGISQGQPLWRSRSWLRGKFGNRVYFLSVPRETIFLVLPTNNTQVSKTQQSAPPHHPRGETHPSGDLNKSPQLEMMENQRLKFLSRRNEKWYLLDQALL